MIEQSLASLTSCFDMRAFVFFSIAIFGMAGNTRDGNTF
jgi:hypothetical protein